MRKILLMLIVLICLASCSTYSAHLVSARGATADCESKSFMALGSWRAGAMQEGCVVKYSAQGYRQLP